MTKRKLFEEIRHNPKRYYRAPSDVNRDRRFSDEERLQILTAWEDDMRSTPDESESGSRLREVADARAEVENRLPIQSRLHVHPGARG
jgi:hypothetical protein